MTLLPFVVSAHIILALVSIVVIRPPLLCLFALESLLTPCYIVTVLLFADGWYQREGGWGHGGGRARLSCVVSGGGLVTAYGRIPSHLL